MTEQRNNIVGVLQNHEMLAIIEALEWFEKEMRTIVDQTPDSELGEEWAKRQSLAVNAGNALGMLRLIQKNTQSPAYTIHREWSFEQAMNAWGKTFKPELREEEQCGEWGE